jgi:hypothetical protein
MDWLHAILCRAALLAVLVMPATVAAKDRVDTLADEEVTVVERSDRLLGIADNATEGVVGAQQLAARPLSRVGEVLETVPGLILTQHSGSGKANQFFLRGFNLDHGTDFATFVDGMPVNLPTHGHGQGYTDLNFLIPELISGIHYRKGPYYVDAGDFSAAGAARISLLDKLPRNVVELTIGHYGYQRGLLAGSTAAANGTLLGAIDAQFSDGPWDLPENSNRYTGVVRYGRGTERDGWHVTGMAYGNDWNSTDQIPQRAVRAGLVSRFGALDDTNGGRTHRYSLSGSWQRASDTTETHLSGYAIDYGLNLFSNFTYFLDDPDQGDQFEQEDRRQIYGGEAHRHWFGTLGGLSTQSTAGLQLRYDDIDSVGLFHSQRQRRLGVTRQDAVRQLSVSPYLEQRTQWLPKLRTQIGLRGDFHHFDVDANNALNSGTASDGLASPKASLILGPWLDTEFYLSGGYGFHSNDARGTTIRVDPASGAATDRVDALVRAKGAEVGLRSARVAGLQTTISSFLLDIESELLFIGDAGNTEASRPSRRYGIEWTNYYTPVRWLSFDADFSFSKAAFKDEDPAGEEIPGAIERVVAVGATVHDLNGYFRSLRLRYFGSRPLIEDDSARSDATLLLNGEAGYEFRSGVRLALSAFNLLDAEDNDIDYFYASRLAGEPADGVEDRHFHPVEPAQLRLSLTLPF